MKPGETVSSCLIRLNMTQASSVVSAVCSDAQPLFLTGGIFLAEGAEMLIMGSTPQMSLRRCFSRLGYTIWYTTNSHFKKNNSDSPVPIRGTLFSDKPIPRTPIENHGRLS